MGFGKKKDDGGTMGLLGHLKAEPWEREPLTEVQPFRDNLPQLSHLDDPRAVMSAGERETK